MRGRQRSKVGHLLPWQWGKHLIGTGENEFHMMNNMMNKIMKHDKNDEKCIFENKKQFEPT